MGSWGADTADESKPKHLTPEERAAVFATEGGWSQPAQGNDDPNAQPEILACVGDLAVGGLGAANITNIELANPEVAPYVTGEAIDVLITWNERVVVTGGPPYVVLGFASGTPTTGNAIYVSGSGTNQLLFRYTPIGAGDDAAAGEFEIDTATASIQMNGGSISDANEDLTASATASGANMTTAGADGATDLRAAFNTANNTITVN